MTLKNPNFNTLFEGAFADERGDLKAPEDTSTTPPNLTPELSLYDIITFKRSLRTEQNVGVEVVSLWRQKLEEYYTNLHLQGEHDQATHAPGKQGSDVTHIGFDDWPPAARNAVLSTVSRLQDKYGIRPEVNATPSTVEGRRVTHYNPAEESGALAAVERGETTIHVNPNLADPRWSQRQLAREAFIANTIQDAITHEYGHVLQGAMEQRNQNTQELTRPFVEEAERAPESSDFRSADVVNTVSFYATDNPDEGVAEAFLQHEKGTRNRYSDHVGNIYKEVFRNDS